MDLGLDPPTPEPDTETRPGVSDARLSSVLDTAVDGIVVIDEDGRILAFNKSCEVLFGYSSAEAIGRNVTFIMPPGDAGAHDGYMESYKTTGIRRIIGVGREVSARHRDGTVFPVELSVGEARTPIGRQYIGILRDLRSRRLVEQRLAGLQAQVVHMTRLSAMDEMGAAMAHELNQPLTALMLYLQAVMRQFGGGALPPSDKIYSVLGKALGEAERARCIIQRMRQMAEKRDPERVRVDLCTVVEEAVSLSSFVAQGSTVDIRRRYREAPLHVDVDAIQIQQIIVNLMRNAVEVARSSLDRWVDVEVRSNGVQAEVRISDSGPGLSSDVEQSLFRTFSTTKKHGMGLGLAISRSIAQNHGGDLTAESGGDGKGATFILTLPTGDAGSGPRGGNGGFEP